jgi:hypothetical protein
LRFGHGLQATRFTARQTDSKGKYGSSCSWLALAHGNYREHKED